MDIDSFWVECMHGEAERKIFPYLDQNWIDESKSYYEPAKEKINKYSFETDRLCFLISKDLKTIVPFPWYYPYSGQWNAYCPFVKIKEIEIEDLSETTNVDID